MRCPFLDEATVWFCAVSPYQKMVPSLSVSRTDQRCTSQRYVDCPLAQEHHDEAPPSSSCPHLREARVQYCTAAPVKKFIPMSDDLPCRCATEAYQQCPCYLQWVSPDRVRSA